MMLKRSWFKLSLRTILVAFTLLSGLFAWQFYYRAEQARECERIRSLFVGTKSHANIHYYFFGWEIPDNAVWLRPIAYPQPLTIRLMAETGKILPPEYAEVARRCIQFEYDGTAGGDDAFLRSCLSGKTEILKVNRNGVSPNCLSFVHQCPELREVQASYVKLSADSFTALLTHPRIETLDINEDRFELRKLPALQSASALRRMEISPTSEWLSEEGDLHRDLFDESPKKRIDVAMSYVWLRQCERLEEITLGTFGGPKFVEAVGFHLSGVERFKLWNSDIEIIEALATWKRLRWLCIQGAGIDDARMAILCRACPNLQTLELDEFSQYPGSLTPQGIRALRDLPQLKRLHLGWYKLNIAHMQAIAELKQLEELSLEDQSLDDAAITPLQRLPRLKRINLERTKATAAPFSTIRGDWQTNRSYRT